MVYKTNELFQRHTPSHNTLVSSYWTHFLPPLFPPNPLAWYLLQFGLSLLHFLAYFTIVGVDNASRRQTGGRIRRPSSMARDGERWRGREEVVRVARSPSVGPESTHDQEDDISDFAGDGSGEGEDEEDGEGSEDSNMSSSSEDEEDLIDIPRPGAPSLRHRTSTTSSWRAQLGDEESGQDLRAGMTRSISRRSGMSFTRGSRAEGGKYGSMSLGEWFRTGARQTCRQR